jgi:catalase
MTHVDRERILGRIVHARGSVAHGVFRPYKGAAKYSRAAFLQDPAVETPIFVRFSTIAGGAGEGAGEIDPSRDLRRFAAMFYTSGGVFDLVGNNVPGFFPQDEIACPDCVHSMNMEPDPGLSNSASTYDRFWDIISLAPESLPMVMWVMSDRAIPRSYRMMEGFGLHTFRMVDAEGRATFTRWHWRSVVGIQSVRREVAANINRAGGADQYFHRHGLLDSIRAIRYPAWELAIQPIAEDKLRHLALDSFEPTKRPHEEQIPWVPIGRMVLDRWQNNFFTDVEHAAFHPGRLVPGIEVVDDPRCQCLIQHRAFSYTDRQLHHLGDAGRTSDESSRSDHYSQARMFWRSTTSPEQRHITSAFTFELSKIEAIAIRRRMLGHLDIIDPELGGRVADALGMMEQAQTVRPLQPERASRPWSMARRAGAGRARIGPGPSDPRGR